GPAHEWVKKVAPLVFGGTPKGSGFDLRAVFLPRSLALGMVGCTTLGDDVIPQRSRLWTPSKFVAVGSFPEQSALEVPKTRPCPSCAPRCFRMVLVACETCLASGISIPPLRCCDFWGVT